MRIASLVPGATEMVAALGLADRLVAVSHECDYPPEVASLPRITRSILPRGLAPVAIDEAVNRAVQEGRPLYSVDGERLVELQPDLVVTQGVCDVCAVSPGTLEEKLVLLRDRLPPGIRMLSMEALTFAEVLEDLGRLAREAGVPERAEPVVEGLRSRWEALPGPSATGPRVLMLEWADPPFYGGHWVPEMVQAAGGRDAMGQPGGKSHRTTWEDVAAADPDLIVAIGCGYGLEENAEQAAGLRSHPRAGAMRAVREGHLWAADASSYFSRSGPRLVRGAELLAGILRGEVLDPSAVRRVG